MRISPRAKQFLEQTIEFLQKSMISAGKLAYQPRIVLYDEAGKQGEKVEGSETYPNLALK